MNNFKQRFEIIYKKYADWGLENGFKPSKLAFSRFIGLSQGAIQKWEKGQTPAAKDIKTIHDKLGFAYDWLIAGEGEMFDDAQATISRQKEEIARLRGMEYFGAHSGKDSANGYGKAGAGEK